MAKAELSFDHILRELHATKFHPFYLLMGEEPFYIDQLSDYLQYNVLNESQKEFDLTVLYGKDTDTTTIINASKRFPMMSAHQVIIVKEAQLIKDLDLLQHYLSQPSPSTILVICYKYGTVDGRKKWMQMAGQKGIVFESKKMRDYEMNAWISKYAKNKNIIIEDKAVAMLTDFLGTDLSKVANELDKLIITKPASTNIISPDLIEKNIGISKDFNVFELLDALTAKNIVKANRIIKYFADNKKANPMVVVLSQLFNYFSNLMMYHYLSDKSFEAVASELKVHPFVAKGYQKAAGSFTAMKTMQILGFIRETDARSKGIGNSNADDGDLLKELIFKILH